MKAHGLTKDRIIPNAQLGQGHNQVSLHTVVLDDREALRSLSALTPLCTSVSLTSLEGHV